MGIKFRTGNDKVIVGTDGSGIKVSNRDDWMRKKFNVRKGWIKVVVLGDEKGDIVNVRVGNENLDERKVIKRYMVLGNIRKG